MRNQTDIVLVDRHGVPLWVMKNGLARSVSKMDDNHLRNSLRIIRSWLGLKRNVTRNGTSSKFWIVIMEAELKRRQK